MEGSALIACSMDCMYGACSMFCMTWGLAIICCIIDCIPAFPNRPPPCPVVIVGVLGGRVPVVVLGRGLDGLPEGFQGLGNGSRFSWPCWGLLALSVLFELLSYGLRNCCDAAFNIGS
uniref:Uncharacterized protein n=1 Tax=Cacopsylla melanoneura TaxID=428564 RepID=A0A8D8SB60_9HEMI